MSAWLKRHSWLIAAAVAAASAFLSTALEVVPPDSDWSRALEAAAIVFAALSRGMKSK